MDTLYPYQITASRWIAQRIQARKVTIVSAETGMGKTYMTAAAIRRAGKRAMIVCPKTAIVHWTTVLNKMGVTAISIVNYESIRTGKAYSDDTYLTRIRSAHYQPNTGWNLPPDAVLVFDECHRCKTPASDNGRMLVAAKSANHRGIPVILVSATMCEVPSDARILLYLLQVSDSPAKSIAALRSSASHLLRGKSKEHKEQILMSHLSTTLAPHTYRVVLSQSEQIMFQNRKSVLFGIVQESQKIEACYQRIYRYRTRGECMLAKIQKLRQQIELAKVDVILEETQLGLEQGYHVVIFVNYLASAEQILDALPDAGYIRGGQSVMERAQIVEQFQADQISVLVCQIAAGGECISLHDTHGDYPRLALISCPDTATALSQAMGRVYRAGQASHVVQKLVFVYGVSYEQTAAERIDRKLSNLSALHNDDLP